MTILFKEFFKSFNFLVKIKRNLSKFNSRPRVFRDGKYFLNLFNLIDGRNIKSLDLSRGLVKGKFKGVEYLLNMTPGNLIETYIFIDGMWEPHIANLISSYLLKSNIAVLDIGANIGATTIPLAKKYPNAKFYLFEPHPEVFSTLQENCSYNKLTNVELINAAISNVDSDCIKFHAQRRSDNMGLSSIRLNHDIKNYETINIRAIQVDKYFSSIKESIAVIKIDTQGSELQVLKSARHTISTHRPVIFFEFESGYFPNKEEENNTKVDILEFFENQRYQLFCLNQECNYLPLVTLNDYFRGDILAVPSN